MIGAHLVGLALLVAVLLAPPQDQPWTPLTLDQPIGLATHWKVARVGRDAERCRALLFRSGIVVRSAGTLTDHGACRVQGAVGVYAGLPPLVPAHPAMSCAEALALAVWERQSVQKRARDGLGAEVVAVDHLGAYACRDIRGGGGEGPSQHAFANAIDISGFRLGDGRRVTVAAHYHDVGPRGAFLRDVHRDACRVFGSALGPGFNAAHHDHLHLDMGGWTAVFTCRIGGPSPAA